MKVELGGEGGGVGCSVQIGLVSRQADVKASCKRQKACFMQFHNSCTILVHEGGGGLSSLF